MNFKEFLSWEASTHDIIDFKKIYVDIAGDINTGLMLSEIVYWYHPSRESGRTKLRIEQEGQLWIACRRYEWWDRTRLTPKQADTAIKRLVKAGLIVKKVFKFKAEPTVHVRLDEVRFLRRLKSILGNPPVNPHLPVKREPIPINGNSVIPEPGITIPPDAESPYTESSSQTFPEHLSETFIDPLTGSDRAGEVGAGLEENAEVNDAIATAWRTKAPAYIAGIRQTLLGLHPFGSTDYTANVSPPALSAEVVELGDYFYRLNPHGKMPTAPAKIQKWVYELRALVPAYLHDGNLRFATMARIPPEITDEDAVKAYVQRYYPEAYVRFKQSVNAFCGDGDDLVHGYCMPFCNQWIEFQVPFPGSAFGNGLGRWLQANEPNEYTRHRREMERILAEGKALCEPHELSHLLKIHTGDSTISPTAVKLMTGTIAAEHPIIGVTMIRPGGLIGEWNNVPHFSDFAKERIPQLLSARPHITNEGILEHLREFEASGPDMPGYWVWREQN